MPKVRNASVFTYNGSLYTFDVGDDFDDQEVIDAMPNKDVIFDLGSPEEEEDFLPPSAHEPVSYEKLGTRELVQLAKNRNLTVNSTKKADLVNALRTADGVEASEPVAPETSEPAAPEEDGGAAK